MSQLIESYIKPEITSFPFCPGCGHTTNLHHVDAAFTSMQLDPKKTVMVTDIGCVGLSDQYFNVHAFHGLHGRSITYATGIKLANPDLDVVVLMGDGGTGIGGHHLISAARRNIGITVLVFNNFNFGMTGGEHSVTTPEGGITATSKSGNEEFPLDICKLAEVSGAEFIARSTTFDKQLPTIISQAIKHNGFSIIDIWEFCTAYYSPKNELNKNKLDDMSQSYEMPFGILVEKNSRNEYSKVLKEKKGSGSKKEIQYEKKFELPIQQRTSVLIAGGAGQKIKSTAHLLAQACMMSGGFASQQDDYPITVMTGYSISELILHRESFQYTGIDTISAILVLSNEGFNKEKKQILEASEDTLILVESSVQEFTSKAKQIRLPFAQTVKNIDKKSMSVCALGALISMTGWLTPESIKYVIQKTQKADLVELSLKAFEAGVDLAKNNQL